jgi:uncharacterized protein DUF2336
MARTPPTFASLEGLLDPNRREGFDIRPTLLRVLTDIYVQGRVHTAEDESYYTELALRLIDAVDVSARAAVAAQLAEHEDAPHAVIVRLARDVIAVAEPVLRFSSRLRPGDLQAIARECGPVHGAIVDARMRSTSHQGSSGGKSPPLPAGEADTLCDMFFAADAVERRMILTNLDYAAAAPVQLSTGGSGTISRLETAALQHNPDAVVRELTRALGIGHRLARRIVEDELGHPLIVAAKALRFPDDVLQRMLLFINPQIGQSVQRVFELASIYQAMPQNAALRLVAIWRLADAADGRSPREPSLYARRAQAELGCAPAAGQAAPTGDSGLRAHAFRSTR